MIVMTQLTYVNLDSVGLSEAADELIHDQCFDAAIDIDYCAPVVLITPTKLANLLEDEQDDDAEFIDDRAKLDKFAAANPGTYINLYND